MTSKTSAAIYLRISLDTTGEGLAVERQRQDCEKIAADKGWDVYKTYIDNSISASKRNIRRPAYEEMIEHFRGGKFDAVICWDLDRLTRQPRQLEDWVDWSVERDLKLVTANGEADLSTDGGRMYARIKAAVARAEVERKSARHIRANLQRAELGKPPAAGRLTGYEKDGRLVESEAAMVRTLFQKFIAGTSMYGLVRWLDAEGFVTRHGNKWNDRSVRSILTNGRYTGKSYYKGQNLGIDGTWPPLIDEASFAFIQAKFADPSRITNRVGTDRRHWGAGLYICGVCGGKLGKSDRSYRCPEGAHVTRARIRIDQVVAETVELLLQRPEIPDLMPKPGESLASSHDAEIQQLRTRLKTFELDYDSGNIDGVRFSAATAQTNRQLNKLEFERNERVLGTASATLLQTEDPIAAFKSASIGEQRNLIDALMTVTVYPTSKVGRTFDYSTIQIEPKVTFGKSQVSEK